MAEAFWLFGDQTAAIQQAQMGLDVATPFAPALLGVMARWCSLVALASGQRTPPERLLGAMAQIEVVDMFDRLEIGLAILRFPHLSRALKAAAESAIAIAIDAMSPELIRESYRFLARAGDTNVLSQNPHPAA
jgi:hypothetical protein